MVVLLSSHPSSNTNSTSEIHSDPRSYPKLQSFKFLFTILSLNILFWLFTMWAFNVGPYFQQSYCSFKSLLTIKQWVQNNCLLNCLLIWTIGKQRIFSLKSRGNCNKNDNNIELSPIIKTPIKSILEYLTRRFNNKIK